MKSLTWNLKILKQISWKYIFFSNTPYWECSLQIWNSTCKSRNINQISFPICCVSLLRNWESFLMRKCWWRLVCGGKANAMQKGIGWDIRRGRLSSYHLTTDILFLYSPFIPAFALPALDPWVIKSVVRATRATYKIKHKDYIFFFFSFLNNGHIFKSCFKRSFKLFGWF